VMLHLVADSASRFFLEQALPGGGGRNVFNVIPVDFRALDTLGEITVLALFALHLYLRGHDLPGGGFVAGITVTMTLIVLYMAAGARWVEARLKVAPVRWIGVGLLLAIATGLAAVVLGKPFLTSHHGHWTVPVLGEV